MTILTERQRKLESIDGLPNRGHASRVHLKHFPKLKICMLAACPFPANHGTPASIREMAESIAELGQEVHIVTYHHGENIPIQGPQLHRIHPLLREDSIVVGPTPRRPLYDLQMVFKTLQVIRLHRPDVLHAHGYEAALVAWICRLVTGLPVLYSGHNTMSDELPSYGVIRPRCVAVALARLLDAVVPRLADRCLPHSTNIQEFFLNAGLKERCETVVNFGIDLDWIAGGDGRKIRTQYGWGKKDSVILYTGVLDRFQRLDLLFQAVAQLVRIESNARLVVVTTIRQDEHLTRLKRRSQELEIANRVLLTDPQPLLKVRDFLQACDVAVVPRPRTPGFPIKLLNYMATKKPCVLFASSASRGLVHRHNIYLAKPDSAEALANGMAELLKDHDLRRRIGHNAYKFVQARHDRRSIAHQMCEVYLRTIQHCTRISELDAERHEERTIAQN